MTLSTAVPRRPSAALAAVTVLAAMGLIVLVVVLVLAYGPREDGTPGEEEPTGAAATPTVSEQGYSAPLVGRVTSDFGPRPDPFRGGELPEGVDREDVLDHSGVDLGGVPEGMPFRSVSAGTVLVVDGGGEEAGNLILVDAGDGHTWRYLHAATGTSAVDEGDVVEPGDVLAGVGATGLATAPHLHLELRVQGETVDPVPYLADRGVVLGEDA